ncbi:HlyC/CorC family transporter [Octadecabacter sp.]|nr:HlyC/CorC family transporter [Octadecabacter sp.]MDC1398204.1 HlyC/CorC family transporter [Octadecabacter sp.]MDC1500816.1 HlyC/CorC family transporter [Octadecabacter sp.]
MLDATFWTTAGGILFLLVLSGFFSGSETALTAASRSKLRSAADKGDKGAQKAFDVTEDREKLIGSVLLGNNLVNILATAMATAMFTRAFGESGVVAATGIMTVLVLIFAEVLPKTYAITNPERAASIAARPISIIVTVFAPVVASVRVLVRGVLRLFGVETDPDSNILAVREEIAGALQLGHSEGVVEKEDRDRILGALDLAERTVEEIMLHRTEIEMIDAALPVGDILKLCLDSNHTRLPLFRDERENIVGVLHAKDLLRAMHKMLADGRIEPHEMAEFDILTVAMKPYFVPETTTLDDQMRQFLSRRRHFALVVDEYGTLQGLITLEDILEEIVGEITDEFDTDEENDVTQAEDGSYTVDGTMTIRDVNRATDWNLPDDEANTVAGLVIHEAQLIPVVGQVFSFHGFRFEVLAKDENRLSELRISPLS